MKMPGRWRYELALPAIVIEQRYLDMVFKGRKCWEIRKRMLPLMRPVLLVAENRLGSRHVAAVAVFDKAVVAPASFILDEIAALAGRVAGRTGVDQKWLDGYVGAKKDACAHSYWRIMAFEPECEGAEEIPGAKTKVVLGTDDRAKIDADARALLEIQDRGFSVRDYAMLRARKAVAE